MRHDIIASYEPFKGRIRDSDDPRFTVGGTYNPNRFPHMAVVFVPWGLSEMREGHLILRLEEWAC